MALLAWPAAPGAALLPFAAWAAPALALPLLGAIVHPLAYPLTLVQAAAPVAGAARAFGVHLAEAGAAALPFAGAALFTRLEGDRLLEHGTRRRILDVVAARPGVTLQGVQAELGVAWGTAVHHVGLLHRHGQLVSVRQGPRRLLFAARTPEAKARAGLAVLRNPTALRVAREVARQPGQQQSALAAALGLQAPSLSKQLARLRAAGLVQAWREGSGVACAPTQGLEEVLRLWDGCQAPRRPARPRAGGNAHGANDAAVLPAGPDPVGADAPPDSHLPRAAGEARDAATLSVQEA